MLLEIDSEQRELILAGLRVLECSLVWGQDSKTIQEAIDELKRELFE